MDEIIKQLDEAVDSMGSMSRLQLCAVGMSLDIMAAAEKMAETGDGGFKMLGETLAYRDIPVIYFPYLDAGDIEVVFLSPTHWLGKRLLR